MLPTDWLRRLKVFLDRFPWVLPGASFAAGWLGFLFVQRGEALAAIVALLALAGWPWLLIEPFVRRWLERRRPGVGNWIVNFISQSLQQELLFFSLPFVLGASQPDAGHVVFVVVLAAAALVSTLDPVYEKWIAAHAAARLLFHGYCTWIAALIVLPIVSRLPVERALSVSIFVVLVWAILSLPQALIALQTWRRRVVWLAAIVVLPVLVWQFRSQIPAAGLAVTEARITQSIEELTPGPEVRRLSSTQLGEGLIAFAAIRAPTGLLQTVVFQWRHGREVENIVETIRGGRQQGWRTWSRKQIFPAEPAGSWTVDILTPQGQLLKRLRFTVE
jgi:predicted membrane channel-forming protein YqfA (hemolysin III family)